MCMYVCMYRDEARMTISAYETLYESSIAYGVRKALVAEQKKIDLDAKAKVRLYHTYIHTYVHTHMPYIRINAYIHTYILT